MPKINVSLSIGISNAQQEDVIDIDQDEWDDCETEEERNDLMRNYWKDLANNFIDGNAELIEE